MIRIEDELCGERIFFNCIQDRRDAKEFRNFVLNHQWLAFDTESNNINCYRPNWELRTAQWGNRNTSYVIPSRFTKTISWAMAQPVKLIGHNGPYDIRCIDRRLGYETGVVCAGETRIPAHHLDSRGRQDGGTGHGLKELAEARIDRNAGKWERELKRVFKEIEIEIPGQVYKSGPRKGTQKYRKAKLAEGWGLIDIYHPAYLAYAAADPILTYRLWELEQPEVSYFLDLYRFDKRLQEACSKLNRRGMLLDVDYTERLSLAYLRKANQMIERAQKEFECRNINSTAQVAEVLLGLNINLTEKTPTDKWKVDAGVLRGIMADPYANPKAKQFVHCVIIAKQLDKRRESYTEAFLRERDENDRVHPSINDLAARTARMSVSAPPLQQLPTKDHEDELMWESEE